MNSWIPTLARRTVIVTLEFQRGHVSIFDLMLKLSFLVIFIHRNLYMYFLSLLPRKVLNSNFRKTSWKRYPKLLLSSLSLVSLMIMLFQLMLLMPLCFSLYYFFSNFPSFWKICFKFLEFLSSGKYHCFQFALTLFIISY